MTWRLDKQHLHHGILDNRIPGKVTGHLWFQGFKPKVGLDLEGDFEGAARGTRLHLYGEKGNDPNGATKHLSGLATRQVGMVIGMDAGANDAGRSRFDWFSESDGRVVLDLDREQVVIEGTPSSYQMPVIVTREQKQRRLLEYMIELSS